ncbi:hypothetical protein ACVWWR_000402 [Bradyrhizobium sp. LM3.2]
MGAGLVRGLVVPDRLDHAGSVAGEAHPQLIIRPCPVGGIGVDGRLGGEQGGGGTRSADRRRGRAGCVLGGAELVGVGGIDPDPLADQAAVEGEARGRGGQIRPGGAVGAALPAIGDAGRDAVGIGDAGGQRLVLGRRAVDGDDADVVDVGHFRGSRGAHRGLAAAQGVRVDGADTYEAADLGLPEGQRARRRARDVAPRGAVRASLPLIGDAARQAIGIAHRRGQNLVLRRRAADAHRAGVIGGLGPARSEHDVAEIVCILIGGGGEGAFGIVEDAGADRSVQAAIADARREALRGGDVVAVDVDRDHVGRSGRDGERRGERLLLPARCAFVGECDRRQLLAGGRPDVANMGAGLVRGLVVPDRLDHPGSVGGEAHPQLIIRPDPVSVVGQNGSLSGEQACHVVLQRHRFLYSANLTNQIVQSEIK